MTINKALFFRELKDYVFITLGLLLYASGFNAFLLPYEITSGGVAGIGSVVFYATGFPVAYTYLLLNVFLLMLAIKTLGWKFCIKTIYAVLMLSIFFEVIASLLHNYGLSHPGEFVMSAKGMPQIVKGDAFMSTILGAACEGIGLGLVFVNNGSTGGTDIIAAVVNKYRDVTLGQVIMFFDILIVSSSLLLPQVGVSKLLYGYCTLIITSLMLDFVIEKARQSMQFFIFSKKYAEIADAIVSTGRGVTVLKGEGWFTHSERNVLVVMARRTESARILSFIQQIDPQAFVSQSKVIGVYGFGFDSIKVKRKRKNQPPLSVASDIPTTEIK